MFSGAQNFTTLSDLMRLYSDVDEIVYKIDSELAPDEVTMLCRDARRLADHVRLRHFGMSLVEIAGGYGIAVRREAWQVAEGSIVFLAECEVSPPVIRLNTGSIGSLAGLMRKWAREADQKWFSESKISEVATAHELSHILEPARSARTRELFAHSFARSMTDLPFSPMLYHELLARMAKGGDPFQ